MGFSILPIVDTLKLKPSALPNPPIYISANGALPVPKNSIVPNVSTIPLTVDVIEVMTDFDLFPLFFAPGNRCQAHYPPAAARAIVHLFVLFIGPLPNVFFFFLDYNFPVHLMH